MKKIDILTFNFSELTFYIAKPNCKVLTFAKNTINGLERPKYLCREKKDKNIKVEKPKKEKIKKVIQKKSNKSVRVDALTKS